ncbi:hypothetical protein XENOCAPTIV_020552, partial [Xenoophorus captivus]
GDVASAWLCLILYWSSAQPGYKLPLEHVMILTFPIRRACRKADRPSMMSRMATVRVANAEKMIDRPKKPPPLREERPRCITMDQSTSDSSAGTTEIQHQYQNMEHLNALNIAVMYGLQCRTKTQSATHVHGRG